MKVMCGVQLKDRKRAKNFMLTFALNETINTSAMANLSALVWDYVEKRGWTYLEMGNIVKGCRSKAAKKNMEKAG